VSCLWNFNDTGKSQISDQDHIFESDPFRKWQHIGHACAFDGRISRQEIVVYCIIDDL